MSKSKSHVYDYAVDLDGDSAPARVIRMVRPGARVLEIGAGPGSITRHLVAARGCHVTALEIDPSAIEILRGHTAEIHSLDLNDPGWAGTVARASGRFDHVIAADVLEHLYDPWTVLGGMKSLLNETGSVILSLPHVGHAAVAACLVDEDFEYRPWGLLDRTHVRFFGIKNIQALYASQGLAIEEAEFVVRTPEMTEFVHRWRRMPQDIRTALQRNRFAHVFQVVTRAVPKERAAADLYLLGQTVVPPDEAQIDALMRRMLALPEPEGADLNGTIGPAPADGALRPIPAPPPRRRRRSLLDKVMGRRR